MQQNILSVSQAVHIHPMMKIKRLGPLARINLILNRRQISKTQVNIVRKLEIKMLVQNLYLLQSLQLELIGKREV